MTDDVKPPKWPTFYFEYGTHEELLKARLKSFFKMLSWRSKFKAWLEAMCEGCWFRINKRDCNCDIMSKKLSPKEILEAFKKEK